MQGNDSVGGGAGQLDSAVAVGLPVPQSRRQAGEARLPREAHATANSADQSSARRQAPGKVVRTVASRLNLRASCLASDWGLVPIERVDLLAHRQHRPVHDELDR